MRSLSIVAIVLAALVGLPAHAADFPDKPITVIVPFPPGGSSDVTARLVAKKMAERVGQSVVIDNKGGANGSIGATALKQAKPDGYTILVGSIGVFAINPALFKDLRYDPMQDFDLLSVAVRTPNVLVATPNFPANTVAELVDYLKKNPNKVTFASSGTGSSDHLTAALFLQKFAPTTGSWAHLDIFAWNPRARPGWPEGGEAQGIRAAFHHISAFVSAH